MSVNTQSILNQVLKKGREEDSKVIELTKDLECAIPFDVLPEPMQDVINEWGKSFPLPKEYYFGGVLAAFSAFIGNSIKIEYKPGWQEPASLYMALVGPASIGKTPALNKVLEPVKRREIAFHDSYKNDLSDYATIKQEAKEAKEEEPPAPVQRQFTIDDFTTEVIAPMLIANPGGLIATADELIGLIKNFGRYSSGSDMEFWLKVWSNEMVKVNRISRGSIFVKQAHVTIVGGIQNKIINELAAGTNVDNGFVARILFVLPSEYKTPEVTDYEARKDVIQPYADAANFIFDEIEKSFIIKKAYESSYPYELVVSPGKIEMDSFAKAGFTDYYNAMGLKMDNASTEWERSALGKLRSYCLRFALILRVMDAGFDREEIRKTGMESDYEIPSINLEVDLPVLDRAIKICNYFEETMTAIVERVTGRKEENIIKDLPENSRLLYMDLPDEFRTGQGVSKASDYRIPERTFKRMLKDENLFTCISRGNYRKNIIVEDSDTSGISGTSGTSLHNCLVNR